MRADDLGILVLGLEIIDIVHCDETHRCAERRLDPAQLSSRVSCAELGEDGREVGGLATETLLQSSHDFRDTLQCLELRLDRLTGKKIAFRVHLENLRLRARFSELDQKEQAHE